MKTSRHHGPDGAAISLFDHRFDQLVIVYFDADGLKRGFQMWLGWPGGADRLRNCRSIYFAREGGPLGLTDRMRGTAGDALVLLCLALDGVFSSRHIGSLADVLQRDHVARRGLVVLFATARSCAVWRRRWPLPENLEFSLGTYTLCPASRTGRNDGGSGPGGYELRAIGFRPVLGRGGEMSSRRPRVTHGRPEPEKSSAHGNASAAVRGKPAR